MLADNSIFSGGIFCIKQGNVIFLGIKESSLSCQITFIRFEKALLSLIHDVNIFGMQSVLYLPKL